MALSLPSSLSPSRVSSFTDCALAFRYSAIDRVPEAPSAPATKGTLVHAALERLLALAPAERSEANALSALDAAFEELRSDPDYTGLELEADAEQRFLDDAERLVRTYFTMEDPAAVRWIGLELRLEARVGDLHLRGIIDRLELDDDGGLVVTDYKTGKVPSTEQEHARLNGVHFYAFLCEQLFGQRPSRVQLMYLSEGVTISTEVSPASTRRLERRVGAVWQAISRACEQEDFRPKPSRLCDWCSFHELCPAQGGDPKRVAEVVAARRAERRDQATGQARLDLVTAG